MVPFVLFFLSLDSHFNVKENWYSATYKTALFLVATAFKARQALKLGWCRKVSCLLQNISVHVGRITIS